MKTTFDNLHNIGLGEYHFRDYEIHLFREHNDMTLRAKYGYSITQVDTSGKAVHPVGFCEGYDFIKTARWCMMQKLNEDMNNR